LILVDERIGSREMLESIRNLGCDCELAHLNSDFQFSGNGPDSTVLISIERKNIFDLCSSIRSNRLEGQQLGPMLLTYDINYLIVEGRWRRGHGGVLEVPVGREWRPIRGNVRYSEVTSFLVRIEQLAGIRVWRTWDEAETCAAIVDRYKWWSKEWFQHKGAALYAETPQRPRVGHKPEMFTKPPTLLEKWLSQLPGIDANAFKFAEHFTSAGDMATAEESRWLRIRGVGKTTAQKVRDAIWRTNGT